LVSWDNSTLSSEAELLAKDAWDTDYKSGKEQNSHDDESEDPLESNCSGKELADSEGSGEGTQGKSHGVVLVNNEEEQSIDQDTPDGNIGQDTCWETVSIDSNGSIPVQCNKSPSQWSRNGWQMNESWVCIVAEV